MSENLPNPFINNTTPTSSPSKIKDGKRFRRRPTLPSSSSSSSLLSSPSKRGRQPNAINYVDRFLPGRTDFDFNAMSSITKTISASSIRPSSTEDQIELQRKRQVTETFDAILKNELFGEKLLKDALNNETGIGRIKSTKNPSFKYNRENSSEDSNLQEFNSREMATMLNQTVDDSPDFSNSDESVSTPPDYSQEYAPFRLPVTPKRSIELNTDAPSISGSTRGASLFTYRSRSSIRQSGTSILASQYFDSSSPVRPDSRQLLLSPSKSFRAITKTPFRVLDAPSLADDFYYDLVDWSSTDMLAVALGKAVFLTDNNSGDVIHLCDTDNEFTSLSWIGAGTHLAVGHSNGLIEIFDIIKQKCIRTLSGHTDRTACLAWNSHILTSGSRDHSILHRDVRMRDPFFEKILTHTQEVCGLKWNLTDNKLVSGGNDNMAFVYDGVSSKPVFTIDDHTAAVKALAWSPHRRGILATGGGTADRKLKTWNINSSLKINEVDTGSQVCNMLWSKNTNEIVTSHGYSKYNLTVWNYPNLEPVAILKGHSFRILHLTLSADGTTVVSGAGDETLRYWKIFDKVSRSPSSSSILVNTFNQIR